MALTESVLEESARCLARHPLRAYDTVQLGSAILARDADPSLTGFLSFDERLAAAAAVEGFATSLRSAQR